MGIHRTWRRGDGLVPGLAALAGAGIAGLATAAGICCVPVVAPLTVALLGAGGAAWAAGMGPYRLPLLIASGGLLAVAHWWVRRPPRPAAAECRRRRFRAMPLVLWGSTALWALSVVVNTWAG